METLEQAERHFLSGDLDKAKKHIDALLAKDPNDADGLTFRARIFASRGHAEHALELVRTVVDKNPKHAQSRAVLGALLLDGKNDSAAETVLSEAVKLDPSSSIAQFHIGRLAARRGDFETAKTHIAVAVRAAPENAMFRFGMARICADLGDVGGAFDHLVATVKLSPTLVEAWEVLATLQLQANQATDAAKNLREAVKHNPGSLGLLEMLSGACAASGDFAGAVDAAKLLCEKAPRNPSAFMNLGTSSALAGDGDAALAAYRRAVTLEESPRSLHMLAVFLEATKEENAKEARTLLERAIALDENDWKVANDLGRILAVYGSDDDAEAAIQYCMRANKRAPFAVEPLFNLALAYSCAGDDDTARTYLDKVRKHPGAPASILAQAKLLADEITERT